MTARRLLFAALAACAIALPVQGMAAQDDPRLDDLFTRLHATGDQAEAQVIQSYIWSIWTEANDDQLNRLMYEGTRAMQVGDLDLAIKTFSDVIDIAPKFAEAWNKRATVYYMVGSYDESIADCMVVLDLEPRHFGALSGRGLVYVAMEELELAIEAFEDALVVHPQMVGPKVNAETLREQLKKQEI